MLKMGDSAPDFALENQDGKTVSLESLRGKKVVLFAYPKAATGGCTQQACGFRDRLPDIEAAGGAVILGLSPDPVSALKKWQVKESLPYDLLSDPEHLVLDAYGVWGEKSMYGRKYMGVIRSHFIIDEEGKLADVQIKVSPAKSVEKAVAFLT